MARASPLTAPIASAEAPPVLVRELAEVADYIVRLREAIAKLRANEFAHDRIPMAHGELGNVVHATASATNAIMAAAEGILALPDDPPGGYRAGVEARVNAIFEACAFQDITGQRIAKVVEALGQIEARLGRFALDVRVPDDAASVDPAEARARARRDALLLNGPQEAGEATSQDEIDALFN